MVDYAYNQDMYVVLNIHWDGGWLEEHPHVRVPAGGQPEADQLLDADRDDFRDYNERMLFAGTNEVHADYNTPTTEHITVQQSYNQTFVNAVRATGGNNSSRTLVVQTYNTNSWHGLNYFSMPSDSIANRLIVEIHHYDPYDYTLNPSGPCLAWGAPFPQYSQCSWAQESYHTDLFAQVRNKWVAAGIPVIIGEYGVARRSNLERRLRASTTSSTSTAPRPPTASRRSTGTTAPQSGASDVFALFDRNSGVDRRRERPQRHHAWRRRHQHHVCAGGDQERHRHRYRHFVAVGHQLRLDLQRQLQQRNVRHADRRGGQRLDVRRLGRRVQRHGDLMHGVDDGGAQRHRDVQQLERELHAQCHESRQRHGHRDVEHGKHQLRQHLQRELRQRHVGDADGGGGAAARRFAGWSGACSGTGACTVSMTQARAVTATFNTASTFALGVTRAGTGTGTVTSSPSGINCGTSCTANYASGASVTLTATAASGSTFAGWSGSCSGTGSCVLSMTASRSVTATFNTSGGGTGGTCANPVTFTNQTGNFNTTGAVCYRTNQNIAGWGCSNFDGRTLTVGGVARTCGQLPLTRAADGYYYFAVTAGQFSWASLYAW